MVYSNESESSSKTSDPFAGQRSQALEGLKSGKGWGQLGVPQIPTWMQGPASTISPLTKMLNESISTGLPTNISAIAESTRNKALRDINQDVIPQLLEKFSVGGNRFSTAATDAISKTAGDVISNLAINESQLAANASESAAGRRIQSGQMAGLPMELQKIAMLFPELFQFIMGITPTTKQKSEESGVGISLTSGS